MISVLQVFFFDALGRSVTAFCSGARPPHAADPQSTSHGAEWVMIALTSSHRCASECQTLFSLAVVRFLVHFFLLLCEAAA